MAKLRWLGHSAFIVELENKTILIDPFLADNPKAAVKPAEIKKADLIVVTHEHMDHYGDSVILSKRLNTKIVALFETANKAEQEGAQAVGANIGSKFEVEGIKLAFTQAIHTGNVSGVVLFGEGLSIYHAGDTGLFGDMKLIAELYHPYAALLPIGGYFTMGPEEAAIAVSMLHPKVTIPMHYGTFPVISGDPYKFKEFVEKSVPEVTVLIPSVGEEIELPLK